MVAVALHLARIAQGWAAAWRNVRSNPLLAYWGLAQSRRVERQAWWRRSPGLLLAAAVISLSLTALLVLLILRVTGDGASAASTAKLMSTAILATSLLLLGGVLYCLLWLAARFFTAAQLALGFLER